CGREMARKLLLPWHSEPRRPAARGPIDRLQEPLVCLDFRRTGPHHDEPDVGPDRAWNRLDTNLTRGLDSAQDESALPTCHRQVDVGKDPCVQQCAVELAMRVVDRIALAKCVEAVALAGMHLACEHQRVEYRAQHVDLLA